MKSLKDEVDILLQAALDLQTPHVREYQRLGQSPHVDSYGVDHFHLYGRKHGSNTHNNITI